MPREDFTWAQAPLEQIIEWNVSNRESIAGGGNVSFSRKTQEFSDAVPGSGIEMLCSPSGKAFGELTLDKMALTSGALAFDDMAKFTDKVDTIREDQYEESRKQAALNQEGKKNTIEHPVHALLADHYIRSGSEQVIVYHPHKTSLSILTSSQRGMELLNEGLGKTYLEVPFQIPGIGLGQTVQKMMPSHKGELYGVIQENHGAWIAAPDFKTLESRREQLESTAWNIIREQGKKCGYDFDKNPFGENKEDTFEGELKEDIVKNTMEAIYEKVFDGSGDYTYDTEIVEPGLNLIKLTTEEGVMYLNTTDLARKYAQSKKAKGLAGYFTRTSPDSIVSAGLSDNYIDINDATDILRLRGDIQEQVEKGYGDMYSRTFVIEGIGIATVGGHYKSDVSEKSEDPMAERTNAARNAAIMVNDTLQVEKYASLFGPVKRLSGKDSEFIANKWTCELERGATMRGAK